MGIDEVMDDCVRGAMDVVTSYYKISWNSLTRKLTPGTCGIQYGSRLGVLTTESGAWATAWRVFANAEYGLVVQQLCIMDSESKLL